MAFYALGEVDRAGVVPISEPDKFGEINVTILLVVSNVGMGGNKTGRHTMTG